MINKAARCFICQNNALNSAGPQERYKSARPFNLTLSGMRSAVTNDYQRTRVPNGVRLASRKDS
jgi:hypothetical protein